MKIRYKYLLVALILTFSILLSGFSPAQSQSAMGPSRPGGPRIALTFDDGPGRYTPRILDILKKYNAKATFFVLGYKIFGREDTLRRIVSEGHEIGVHSWQHRILTKLPAEDALAQYVKTRDAIIEATGGYIPTIMRPPYGIVNTRLRKAIPAALIIWTVDSKDWKLRNSKKVSKLVLNKTQNGDIVLMHDTYESTVNAVEILLKSFNEKGYRFVTTSEILKDRESYEVTPKN